MEAVLAGVGLGVGLLGALLSFLIPVLVARPSEARARGEAAGGGAGVELLPYGPLLVALAAVGVLFLVSLQAAPPFSPGQKLGWGLLIGGLAAVLAVGGGRRPQAEEMSELVGSVYRPYPAGLALSLALAALSLTLLCFQGDPADALLGVGLGFLVVAVIFRSMQGIADEQALALEAGGALAATLAAGCALAVEHFGSRAARGWWAYLLALSAFWFLGRMLAYTISERPMARAYPMLVAMVAAVGGVVVSVVLGGLLGLRLEPAQPLVGLLAVGIVTGALVAWLAGSARADGASALPGRALNAAALAVVLMVFLVVVTFKMLGGFGVAAALVAAWAVVAAVQDVGGTAPRLSLLAMMVGASFLFVRLFLARAYSATEHAEITPHYVLVGVVLGVMLPFTACAFRSRQGLGRAILVGAITGASPLLLLLLWGAPAALGFLLGLVGAQAVSTLFVTVGATSAAIGAWQAPASLMAISMSLLAVQAASRLPFLHDLPRQHKAYVVGGVALLVVLWAIGAGLAQLRGGRVEAASSREEG
jgi:hypothetical protein